MSAAEYHADPAPAPSLTASIANILINQSPAHARAAHPRLNPNYQRKDEERFDLGQVVHSLLLEGIEAAHVILADDWRTKAAKEARDEARAHGRIPLLAKQMEDVKQMVDAARAQIASLNITPALLTEGQPEQTLMWEDEGIWCRARLDWFRDDKQAIDDVKTCSASAHPERWTRTMLGIGADVQARWYQRGVRLLHGHEPEFRFIVIETTAPFALSVVGLSPSLAALADSKIDYALRTWKRCLERDEWPSYPRQVAYIEAPPWAESQWLEREAMEAAA